MLSIRAATAADYEGICQLITSEEEMFLIYPAGSYPLTIEQLDKLSVNRKELTVALAGKRIIGFANLYDVNKGEYAFIGNVVVDKRQRGEGVGKALIAYMLTKANEKYKLPQVRISVFSENTIALLLYGQFDFRPYEIEERLDKKGRRVALIHMRKIFDVRPD